MVALPQDGPLAGDLRRAGIEVIVRPLSVLRRTEAGLGGLARTATAAARDARALKALIAEREVALVHSNTSVVLGGAAAARAGGVPHIWHVREIYARFGRVWPVWRAVLARAAALPCVSGATAAQFAGGARTSVIHDGLVGDPARAERAAARGALGIDSDGPAIGLMGRISDWKGQDVLVRALADPVLAERGVLAVFAGEVWPGAEERLESVLELAEVLGVRERVKLVGFRQDLENVLGACEVIAVPSTHPDPLPNAAIEAAAAGCAVIASANGGLPEILKDRRTGLLVPPGDASALAHAAARLIDDPPLRAELGAAAREDVRERFAPARLLERVQDLYDSVLR